MKKREKTAQQKEPQPKTCGSKLADQSFGIFTFLGAVVYRLGHVSYISYLAVQMAYVDCRPDILRSPLQAESFAACCRLPMPRPRPQVHTLCAKCQGAVKAT